MIWIIYLIIFYISSTIYNQYFKIGLNRCNNINSYMCLISILTGLISLIFIVFYDINLNIKFNDIIVLIVICILYAITNRLNVLVRDNMEVSLFSVLRQISSVFMMSMGILFFKEKILLKEILGGILIILSNIIVLYNNKSKIHSKYILLGILSNLLFSIILFLNVDISRKYNVPFFISIITIIPGIIMSISLRISISKLLKEYNRYNKLNILLTSISSSIMLISQLKAYELGKITLVAPLCSLTVIINIIISYIYLKEKNNIFRKIIGGILVMSAIYLIKG